MKCKEKVEVWQRCCGYFANHMALNKGKAEEVKERKKYSVKGIKEE